MEYVAVSVKELEAVSTCPFPAKNDPSLGKMCSLLPLLYFFLFLPLEPLYSQTSELTLERSRALALIFSSLQCITPTNPSGTSTVISEINRNFDPVAHLNEYQNPNAVLSLLEYINNSNSALFADGVSNRNDDPFTNTPEHISQLGRILYVLYPNSVNFPLFYNTSAWLINRVNDAQLWWALMVVCGEKLTDSVLAPSAIEVFPQLFLNKGPILEIGGMAQKPEGTEVEHSPLQYWLGDPAINEFHTHWHVDNPFWWNETLYGVKRERRGELFFYMHHQLLNRYMAEQLSNGVEEVKPLEFRPDYQIPEPYYPDIINNNYGSFPSRRKGEPLRNFDDRNGSRLEELRLWHDRLTQGIEQGYFVKEDGTIESLEFDNGSSILGDTTEASTVHSVNAGYYGSFHNLLHRFLGGFSRESWRVPGVEAHSETAVRDPVFFRLHRTVDDVYLRLKHKSAPYTQKDLDFWHVSINSFEIQTPRHHTLDSWLPQYPGNSIPTLTTYFNVVNYDISTAARPCRGINEEPTYTSVNTLTHVPFKYIISIKSTRNEVANGVVRIFMWPEYDLNGRKYDTEECHRRAIELDRFQVQIEPNKDTLVQRSSLNSSITRFEHPPGIKQLYKTTSSNNHIFRGGPQQGGLRACGYPNNLLIPKGTKDGMKFKVTVIITEEPIMKEYANYPLCGSLNGLPYSDARPMGFPFDRLGTKFITYAGTCMLIGGCHYKNVRELRVIVKHRQEDKWTEQIRNNYMKNDFL